MRRGSSPALPFEDREPAPLAAMLCLIGILLHIVVSGPLLDAHGVHYNGDEGAFYQKLHPGSYFIYCSFACLLLRHGNPLRECFAIYRRCPVYTAVFALNLALLLYMCLRDGPGGLAFLIDSHITALLCLMVLSFAPFAWCARAVNVFVALAALNGLIGIAEAWGHFRIFTFAPDWEELAEKYFRASALRGYALANAAFTAIAVFVVMALRYGIFLKLLLLAVFLLALLAFGGRSGFFVSVAGIALLGAGAVIHTFTRKHITLLKLFLAGLLALVVPVVFAGGLLLAFHSGMGERLAAYASLNDESADSRQLAWMALDYMSGEDMLFGISTSRIEDITAQLGMRLSVPHIENPWVLMLMHLGAIGFTLWLAGTAILAWRLVRGQNLPLKLTAISYFIIASTYNSFATKDSTWLILVSVLLCAGRSLHADKPTSIKA